jgi:FtsH-binding integral membrane protein
VALALGLLPFELAFWIGFALPFGFVFGAARTALVIFLFAQARGGPERLRPDAGTRGRSPARSTRAAAVLTWVYAACFGIPAIPVAVYLRQHGTLPWFGDLFQMYGGPWSLRVGIDAFAVRLIAFLALMLVAAWTGWLMWRGSTLGAVANLALLPVEAVFWAGFALPVPWVIGLARATLIAMSWLAQKRRAPAHSPDPLGSPAAGTGPLSDAGGTKNAPE